MRTMEELEARKAEIAALDFDNMAENELAALEEERKIIDAEMAAIKKNAEERKALEANVLNSGEKIETIINEKEKKTMTATEIRSSVEYGAAFLKGIKENDYSECRALLSTNGTNSDLSLTGYVPVPTELESEIKTAWEEAKLLSIAKKSYFPGNVKVGFELSATGASIHLEGDSAPDEEVITIGTVELKAESIKKWITVSDEALEGTTVDTIGYLYKELAQRIVEKAEEVLIGKILAAPTSAQSNAVSVPVLTENTPAVDTIIKAMALLSAQAKNLNIVMNRATYPVFRALELGGNYAFDIFEGLRDRIIFSSALPSYAEAAAKVAAGTYPYVLIGDFSYGTQANLPNGDGISIKVDDMSLAEKDLVKLVAREYIGLGVVADKAIVKIAYVKNS